MARKEIALQDAMSLRRSCRDFSGEAIGSDALQRLLWAGQGNTDDSGHLTTPSADALHPLRLFIAVGNVTQYEPGLFRAAAANASLICVHGNDIRAELEQCAIEDQPWVREAACIISICADFLEPTNEFAEQLPYGGRGSRYVYIEAGAAAQNIALQATEEGLGCVLVAGFRDDLTADALGLEAPLMPVLHLCIGVPS